MSYIENLKWEFLTSNPAPFSYYGTVCVLKTIYSQCIKYAEFFKVSEFYSKIFSMFLIFDDSKLSFVCSICPQYMHLE